MQLAGNKTSAGKTFAVVTNPEAVALLNESVSKFKRCAELAKSGDSYSHHHYAMALQLLGRHKEACVHFADSDWTNKAELFNDWGNSLFELGDFGASTEKFKKAVTSPGSADMLGTLYYNLGNSLRKQGRHKEACEAFAEAVKH